MPWDWGPAFTNYSVCLQNKGGGGVSFIFFVGHSFFFFSSTPIEILFQTKTAYRKKYLSASTAFLGAKSTIGDFIAKRSRFFMVYLHLNRGRDIFC